MTGYERSILRRYMTSLLNGVDSLEKAGKQPVEIQRVIKANHALFKREYFDGRPNEFMDAARLILTSANDVIRGAKTRAEAETACAGIFAGGPTE